MPQDRSTAAVAARIGFTLKQTYAALRWLKEQGFAEFDEQGAWRATERARRRFAGLASQPGDA